MEFLPTIIEGLFVLLAALLPTAIMMERKRSKDIREKEKQKYLSALEDILFLLAVEDKYRELMKKNSDSGLSHFHKVRKETREMGLHWSGTNTRYKIQRRLEQLRAELR